MLHNTNSLLVDKQYHARQELDTKEYRSKSVQQKTGSYTTRSIEAICKLNIQCDKDERKPRNIIKKKDYSNE